MNIIKRFKAYLDNCRKYQAAKKTIHTLQVLELWINEDGTDVIPTLEERLYGGGIEHIRLIISTELVRFHSFNYTSANEDIINAFAVPSGRCIIIPECWDSWDKNVKAAMLFHEIGHIVNKHYIGAKSTMWITAKRHAHIALGVVQKEELEADNYAVSVIGRDTFIAGLTKFKSSLNAVQIKEVNRRIQAVS